MYVKTVESEKNTKKNQSLASHRQHVATDSMLKSNIVNVHVYIFSSTGSKAYLNR